MYINETRVSGRVAQDAKRTGAGPWRFSVAQGGGKKKGSEERWPVLFYPVCAWPDQCGGAESLRKGQEVEVFGRLKPTSWEKEGVKHSSFEIVASILTIAEKTKDPLESTYITDAEVAF